MKPSDFEQDKHGRVIRAPQGYWAYVPDPREPPLEPNLSLVHRLAVAERSLGELAGVARTLPNPQLLIGPFMRREAVLSSKIEGTRASLSDLLLFETARLGEKENPDVREVANYVTALEYGLERLRSLPISLRLIKEIHERLLSGVSGEHGTPGEFRRSQNWIGPKGCTLEGATFVPPPVPEMSEALGYLEKYFHSKSKLPSLLRLALIHYQFEAIHPFLDGNGRIGRLLTTLLMCAEGMLPKPVLYLSAYFERHRQEYYDYLLGVSRSGDWESWIVFFLDAIALQSKDAIERSDRLLALWHGYIERMQEARSSALILRLVDELFVYPVVTNRIVSDKHSITPRSAQMNIEKLVSSGILREATGRQRNRVYISQEILSIIEKQE